MVAAYYRTRGWTPEGLIPETKLRELSLWDLVRPGAISPTRAVQPVTAVKAPTGGA
jgi:hypothetical protein